MWIQTPNHFARYKAYYPIPQVFESAEMLKFDDAVDKSNLRFVGRMEGCCIAVVSAVCRSATFVFQCGDQNRMSKSMCASFVPDNLRYGQRLVHSSKTVGKSDRRSMVPTIVTVECTLPVPSL